MHAVTATQVKAAIRKKYGMGFIPHHECGICEATVGYYQNSDTDLWFDSSCDCGGGGGHCATFQDLANFINMQTNENARKHLMVMYGLCDELT